MGKLSKNMKSRKNVVEQVISSIAAPHKAESACCLRKSTQLTNGGRRGSAVAFLPMQKT
jgi:hypothetical protein